MLALTSRQLMGSKPGFTQFEQEMLREVYVRSEPRPEKSAYQSITGECGSLLMKEMTEYASQKAI